MLNAMIKAVKFEDPMAAAAIVRASLGREPDNVARGFFDGPNAEAWSFNTPIERWRILADYVHLELVQAGPYRASGYGHDNTETIRQHLEALSK